MKDLNKLIKNTRRFNSRRFHLIITAALLLSSMSFSTYSQRFRYGLNFGFTSVKYSFPVSSDDYHNAEIEPFSSPTGGASVQFLVNESFRIGTGVQYISVNGKRDGGQIKGSLANPNSSGELNFEVNNSFLVLPEQFTVVLLKNSKVKPILSGGLNFFIPLKQDMLIEIVPATVNPFYPTKRAEINKDTPHEYFGFFIGTGITVPVNSHEVSLLLNYRRNTSRYTIKDAVMAAPEKHEIRFTMLEVSLGWNFGFKKKENK